MIRQPDMAVGRAREDAVRPLPSGPPRRVHVWQLSLADDRWDLQAAWDVLGPEDRERADRALPVVRRRRILLRAAARSAVGGLLGTAPRHVDLAHDHRGRPVLRGSSLFLSCASDGDVAVVAVSEAAVGIDVQRERGEALAEAAQEGWLTPPEAALVAALPEERRAADLARRWTQKEAVLKAEGVGLFRPPCTVVTPAGAVGRIGSWWLLPLAVPAGYQASLAVPAGQPAPDVTVHAMTPGGLR